MVQQNYFQIRIQQNFRFLSKIVFSVNVIEDIATAYYMERMVLLKNLKF